MIAINRFPHADTVRPVDSTDFACMSEIREVLKKHGALDRFGVCLLHKHFDLDSDEMLEEETDEVNRISSVKPVPRSSIQEDNIMHTAFYLGQDDKIDPFIGCIKGDPTAK